MAVRPNRLRSERFISAYLTHQCASKAAVAAGYSKRRAHQTGRDLMRLPDIAEEIRRREDKLMSSLRRRPRFRVHGCLNGLVENYERAMQIRPVKDENGKVIGGEFRYNGNVANKALELIGRALGVFVDRKEVGQPGEFDHLNDDELEREIAREAELLGLTREREVTEPTRRRATRNSSTRH